MSEFSISYAGIEDAVSQLAKISRKLVNVSSDVYEASSGADSIPSLKNKGYTKKIGILAKSISSTSDQLSKRGYRLATIGQLYSDSETKALNALADRVSPENGFSAQSCLVTSAAITSHQSINLKASLKELIIDQSIGDSVRSTLGTIDSFRYWRQVTAREWLAKHGIDGAVVDATLGKFEKKVNQYEDVVRAVLNPTNPDAVKNGVEAVAGLTGLGDIAQLFKRQAERQNVINDRFENNLETGSTGHAVARYLVDETIYFGQMCADTVYTGVKFVAKSATGGLAGTVFDGLDIVFSGIGKGVRKLADLI